MTNETKPDEVEILDEDLELDTHVTAQERNEQIYLGDGCWGKAEYFEH